MRARSGMLLCVTIGALALCLVGSRSYAEEQGMGSEEAVATINGVAVTKADFDTEMGRAKRYYSGMGQNISESQLSEMKDEVLENLIAREVLYQKSKAEEIKVDEAMLDEHMATLKQQFPSEDEFKKTLGEMGLSEAGLRSDFERAKAIEQLLDEEVSKKIVISDEETKKYYAENPAMFKHPEQVRASHILITVDPKAEDSAKAASRAKLEAVQARLKQGEDFAALAKEVSQCPSASKGGDLGYFRQGQMVEPFEKAAFALKPGEVSDIVETQFGYHLIKVADHKPETVVGYDEIKERIAEHLKQDRLKDEIDRYVDTLKQEAKITKNLPE